MFYISVTERKKIERDATVKKKKCGEGGDDKIKLKKGGQKPTGVENPVGRREKRVVQNCSKECCYPRERDAGRGLNILPDCYNFGFFSVSEMLSLLHEFPYLAWKVWYCFTWQGGKFMELTGPRGWFIQLHTN